MFGRGDGTDAGSGRDTSRLLAGGALTQPQVSWAAQGGELNCQLSDIRQFISHFHLQASDAEDVLQEVARRVWQGSGGFAGDSTRKTYLLGVAKNVLRERRRDEARAAKVDAYSYLLLRPQATIAEDDSGLVESDLTAVRRAVSILPLKLRVAVELFYFRRLPCARAAATAGCSPAAFRRRLARARQCLQTLLTAVTHPRPSSRRSCCTGRGSGPALGARKKN